MQIHSPKHLIRSSFQAFLLLLLCSIPYLPNTLAAAPKSQAESTIINIYKRANAAVVNLNTTSIQQDFFFPVFREGSGSGVIIDSKNALLITNFHVIKGARQIQAVLSNGKSYDVRLVGEDAGNELALLQIQDPPDNIVQLSFANSSELEVGQSVLAIGNPFGLNRTLTQGIISSLGRSIRSDRGTLIEDVIQTDAAINPGNSGGPLLDMNGDIIGINTAIISKSGDHAGIGFAIPANDIQRAIPDLMRYGRVRRAEIGAVFENTKYGVAVLTTKDNSPARAAGLRGAQKITRSGNIIRYLVDITSADFIVGIDETKVLSKDDIQRVLAKAEPGKALNFRVRRGIESNRIVSLQIAPVLK